MPLKNKVTIIGAGMVGSTAAYSLVASDITEEIALVDINQTLVKCQVMDLQHSMPFWGTTKIKVGSYEDIKDSRVVVVSCGAAQKPGETRIDLVKKNSGIMKEVVPKIFAQNPNVILLMITNPVDVLTYQAVKMFPKKKNKILGSGTILDSARFRFLISQTLKVNTASVHAYIVGEHGDSEVPLWSTAAIGNTPLTHFKQLTATKKKQIFHQARNAAYTIIEGKQSTYYAIGAGINQIIQTILFDKKTVLPLSHLVEGEYGIKDICLSLPVILGAGGIVYHINPEISALEKKQLWRSAQTLKKIAKNITL
ncbi:MAG: L-lactate dehydrogenase [Candidatus Buchananbacteria bacterium RIFCSPHIGHO2_01_FULL_39_14]|uniref:L-lactate dehydrogenase n=2 Tax=Candidatus Buchananiibacteriota TaxID=1817903 RepID=A0A1G1YN23_9BACT|nr:MAG: L-lactate dehydrogenase [Candidatus Buchananbacteria bacterium RIFCSPHIGHO2_01_FULL_39_14]OGY48572.1 MAG: L-lactate dehydrogenase [Candidatus Buchananbacteria bacterium RIFCSPHIGHO2_02_FULL_39_17]OGY53691.1 MAG: L-lactate dehydrogenase [Candidatus Buchananbacteria bacterium RIFCSPLOWO2_01_FULL_40_23b]